MPSPSTWAARCAKPRLIGHSFGREHDERLGAAAVDFANFALKIRSAGLATTSHSVASRSRLAHFALTVISLMAVSGFVVPAHVLVAEEAAVDEPQTHE
jgi:hypothetical protein